MICIDNLSPSSLSTISDKVFISIPEISSVQSTKIDLTQKPMTSLSNRIAIRKDLCNRLCLLSNAMFFLGLFGIVLMIINNEIIFTIGDDEDTIVNWLIKLTITVSTIILISLIIYYHKLDLTFYSVKNSVHDWRIGLTAKRILLIIFEILICSIHPVPRYFQAYWSSSSTTPDTIPISYVSLDVALGLPMFARLYLFCRFMLSHSHLAHSASSQSLGYLNQVSMNFFFLIKTYLEQWPIRCLTIFCTMSFLIGSWSLRSCDYRPTNEHLSMLDSMWLFIVTFTTVGYGDTTPSSYCGRGVATIIAFTGVLSTALLISVVAQKLIFTRWEKYVYNFILNIELAKERRNQAANVIKLAIKVWYLKRKNNPKSIQYIKAQWKLYQSIRFAQDVKLQQRRLVDSSIVLADVYTLQRDGNDKIETIVQQINTMNMTIDKIEEKFIDMKQTMDNIQDKLNVLLSRGYIQQTRMM